MLHIATDTSSNAPKIFRLLALFSLVLSSSHNRIRRRVTFSSRRSSNTMIMVEQDPLEAVAREWFVLSQKQGRDYDWDLSTEETYRSDSHDYCGSFQEIRARLDYTYHACYTCERQKFQDMIIISILEANDSDKVRERHCLVPPNPWVVFTAGVMGAGKSFTIHRLHKQGLFPLESFVVVDPDEIRRQLPEFQGYLRRSAEQAGALTRKEAGMMAEILTEAALERGQNVLKDGSLRDAKWYRNYFTDLRQLIPGIRLGIIHVTAPLDVILDRVKERAEETGRIVPKEVLQKTAEQVPRSVGILQEYVDFFLEIVNSDNDDVSSQLVTNGMAASSLKDSFIMPCG